MLELLDLRNNMLNGTILKEIGEILSLKHLLLCHNKFQGSTPLIENPKMHFDVIHDQNLSCGMTNDLGRVKRKVKHCFWETGWQKLKNVNSFLFRLKRRIIQIFEISPLRVLLLSFRPKGGILDGQNERSNNVVEYLNGNGGVGSLVDPTLKTHKDQELETICEVIRDCINLDPRKRPTMKEVTSKSRDVIQISPEVATFSTLVGGAGDRICRSKLTRSLFPCRIMRQPPSGIWLSLSSCKPQSTYLSSLYCTMEDPSASSLAIAIDCEPSGLPVGPARDQGVSIQIHCKLEYV